MVVDIEAYDWLPSLAVSNDASPIGSQNWSHSRERCKSFENQYFEGSPGRFQQLGASASLKS